jgi:subtilisin-like proprotein convertase family protein
VAGLAVARGGNGAGVTGVAPFAGLAGLRTEYDGIALANAYTWHNDSIQIKNHSYGPTAPYDATLAPLAATMTSTATDPAHPAIHVLAAPNGRVVTDGTNFYIGPMADANTDGLNHNPNAITVAAVGSDGFWTDYSSFGANVFVSAPSGSGFGFAGVATTDRTGSDGYNPTANVTDYLDTAYTRTFNGNSAVAPQVSGAIALAVQARNNLGLSTDVRVIKHLLARTSVMVDPTDAFNADSFNSSDGGWRTNAAGFHFNQNYGFGMINVNALTQAATQYSGVTPQVTYSQPTTNVNLAIPDNNTTGISRTFTMSSSPGKLEEVEVHLNITHTYRGDIEAYITSPSGYRSRLVFANEFDSGANIDWTFTTNAFWGEGVNGNWTITVMDLAAADTGTWNSYAVTFYTGDLVPIPEPGAILAIAVGALGLGVGYRRLRRGVTVTPTLAA